MAVQYSVQRSVQLALRYVAQKDANSACRKGSEHWEQRVPQDTAQLPADTEHFYECEVVRHRAAAKKYKRCLPAGQPAFEHHPTG